jgi:hypothetical protein
MSFGRRKAAHPPNRLPVKFSGLIEAVSDPQVDCQKCANTNQHHDQGYDNEPAPDG